MHLLEWPQSRTLTTPNAGKEAEQQELSFIAGVNAKWYSHFGGQSVSYKTIHTPTIWSSNCTPWYVPTGVENLYLHKNLHKDVYSNVIKNGQNLDEPKYPSADEWINKLSYIQTMQYYSVLKRNELSSHKKTRRDLKCVLLSERSQSEKASYYMTLWKRQNYADSKKIRDCQRLEE